MPASQGIAHALLAVDGSPASQRAVLQAGRLLAAFPGARVTILYVAHLPRDLQMTASGDKVIVEFPLSGLVRATAAPVFASVSQALGALAERAETEVQVGEPAREICEFAAAEDVDLIIMGVRGSGDDGVAVGSVSTRVLSLAPCPVMLVQ